MKVATWNLESLRRMSPERATAFRDAMLTVNADIWILTETWLNFGPGDRYRLLVQSSGAADLLKWPDRCWVSIWARAHFEMQSEVVSHQADRIARGRIAIPGTQDVVVVGTLLPWASDSLFPGAEGFCKAVSEQEKHWTARNDGAEASAYILAGDFNQSLPFRRSYGSKIGEDCLRQSLEKHSLRCLTEAKTASSTSLPAIDHICVSRGMIRDSTVPVIGTWDIPELMGKPITDHRGIFIVID